MRRILGFNEEYRWLSNFWVGHTGHVEGRYQSYKLSPPYPGFMQTLLPNAAKKLGHSFDVQGLTRKDWREVKVGIMESLLEEKLEDNPQLLPLLLATEDAYLEETNYWGDTFWGVCKGKGENNLGRLWMKIRRRRRFIRR